MVKEKIKALVRGELEGWRAWEILWMTVAIAVIIGLSLYWNDTVMGIISSVTGVACVVCTGKGKLSAYLFGLVNCVLYAIIAYKATYYGETMLNLFYYVPMQFVGFFVWAKNMNPETGEVNKKHMSGRARILMTAIIAAATYAYGLVLAALGDAMPFVDSFTTVCSVVAMVVSVGMFAEQWWIWVAVNVFSVYLWWTSFAIGADNIATLLMWIVYLGNSVIMLVKWERDAIRAEKEAAEYEI